MTYKDQIRSKEWLEFATAFKTLHGWKCDSCQSRQSRTNELSVHHIYYLSGVKMWEHPYELLECLCFKCHEQRQSSQRREIAKFAASLNINAASGYQFPGVDESEPDEPITAEFFDARRRYHRALEKFHFKHPSESHLMKDSKFHMVCGTELWIAVKTFDVGYQMSSEAHASLDQFCMEELPEVSEIIFCLDCQ